MNHMLDILQKSTELYAHKFDDPVIHEHEVAKACYEFEDLLQAGVVLFDFIGEIDEKWRLRVMRGECDYDAEAVNELRNLYRIWLRPSERVEGVIEFYESRFDSVEHAKAYRSRVREARGILTDDEEFFSGDKLADLRDSALDEHERGETLEYGPQ